MTAILDRGALSHRLAPVGAPVRVAFVGRESEMAACALHRPAGGLRPTFVDARPGVEPAALRAALAAAAPHVVVVLGAEEVPVEGLAGTRAVVLGVLPGCFGRAVGAAAPDDGTLAERIRAVDATAYDRLLSADPAAGDHAEVWRSSPLPVDDRLFAPVRRSSRPPRSLVLAPSTEHRDRFIIQAKHEYDVLHYAHGLWGDSLVEVLGKVDIGINAHPDPFPRFAHTTLVHLAAGHLLLSEPLEPLHGLEPEIDFVPLMNRDELLTVLHQLRRRPDLHERVRLRGRAKAEAHRASAVWPRLVHDLLADVAAFGTARAVPVA